MPICEGARVKIERANHHIADLEGRIDRLKKRLIATTHINTDTGCEYIECDFADAADMLGVSELPAVIGDAVHNLKCALDHVWLATIMQLVPSGKWKRTKFPVYPTRNELEAALRELQIDTLAPNFFLFIVSEIKPYDGGDFAIRPIHRLDTRDKHRLLIPAIQYSAIGDIEVEDESGQTYKGDTWSTADRPPLYVNYTHGIHIKNPGSASFDVMFEDGDGAETRAVDTLRLYSRFIAQIVKLLEEFVEA